MSSLFPCSDEGKGEDEAEDEGDDVPSSPSDLASAGFPISQDLPRPATAPLMSRVASWAIARLLCSGRGAASTTISTAHVLLTALHTTLSIPTTPVALVTAGPVPGSGLVLGGRGRLPFAPSLADAPVALAAVNASGVTIPACHALALYQLQLLACVEQAVAAAPRALATQETLGTVLELCFRWGGLEPCAPSDAVDALPLHVLTSRVKLLGSILRHLLCSGYLSCATASAGLAAACSALRTTGSTSLWAAEGGLPSSLPASLLHIVGAVAANVAVSLADGVPRVTARGIASQLSAALSSEFVCILRALLTAPSTHLGAQCMHDLVQAVSHGDRAAADLACLIDPGSRGSVEAIHCALGLCGALGVLGGHTEVLRIGGCVHVVAGAGGVLGDKCVVVGLEAPMGQGHPPSDAATKAFEGVEVSLFMHCVFWGAASR